jgi:hypothetical protein
MSIRVDAFDNDGIWNFQAYLTTGC